jgi:tRNA-dihydrouridine synthase B
LIFLKIKNLDVGRVFLAPMAGVTDLAFRSLCREFGADLAFSEMVSAKAMGFNDKKTFSLLNFDGEPHYRAAQLFGSDPEILSKAAFTASGLVDIIDINMGCPAPKITGNGEGSALMKNPDLAAEIINRVCKSTDKPVTVKIRKGFDETSVNAVEIARIAEENGAAAITVHGRTTSQHYSGQADPDIIRAVKHAVNIPVIGNGDIASPADAERMLAFTGCDGIMIGRGALGNPFIFREIKAYLSGRPIPPPGIHEKITVALRHVEMLVRLKGEHIGILEARKHVSWYVKGIPGASALKNAVNSAKTQMEMQNLLSNVLTGKA